MCKDMFILKLIIYMYASVKDMSRGVNSLFCGMGGGGPCGAVVSPWLVWTVRTVGRGGGAAAEL